eukprot:TRINITY_DN9426_c0_g4_i2.p1 TRINITY_DN9426_c0_g4~~TRINITY_DN9426_c0_g4_i2.p1  ORF type:complete len:389 (-),score=107.70 TRINITY_DN9426_c0_g4_i2:316-1482(-)
MSTTDTQQNTAVSVDDSNPNSNANANTNTNTNENTETPIFQKLNRNRSNLRKRKTSTDANETETNSSDPHQVAIDETMVENPTTTLENPTRNEEEQVNIFKQKKSIPQYKPNPLMFKASDFKEKSLDINFAFNSNKSAVPRGSQDQFATAVNEIDTADDRDATSIQKRNEEYQKQRQKLIKEGKVAAEDNIYRGMNYYDQYIPQGDTSGKIKGAGIMAGPIRASATIRVTSRFDYQPDICKDYKETGYCGFGDACKFMHDRGDYKTGWQLEREWEEEQKIKREKSLGHLMGSDEEDEDGTRKKKEEDDYNLPFACLMCQEHFTIEKKPVVTKCGHYFDYACARKMLAKNGRCHVCAQQTQGIINTATDVIKRLEMVKAQKIANGSDSD